MPKSWRAANFIEPVTDSMAEQFGNAANYCVVSGCEPQYSGSGLSVTVSAGVIKHNGRPSRSPAHPPRSSPTPRTRSGHGSRSTPLVLRA
jgi:hypothetical protein